MIDNTALGYALVLMLIILFLWAIWVLYLERIWNRFMIKRQIKQSLEVKE